MNPWSFGSWMGVGRLSELDQNRVGPVGEGKLRLATQAKVQVAGFDCDVSPKRCAPLGMALEWLATPNSESEGMITLEPIWTACPLQQLM